MSAPTERVDGDDFGIAVHGAGGALQKFDAVLESCFVGDDQNLADKWRVGGVVELHELPSLEVMLVSTPASSSPAM
jgi:hypothetical protein